MMARKRSKGLSERQKKILEVLERFQAEYGYPPSIREICEQASISSTSVVNYYLDQLQEMGYIDRDSRVSRGIRLLKPVSEIVGAGATSRVAAAVKQSARNAVATMVEMMRVPVVGRIVASAPAPVPSSDFSYFDPESMVEVASSMLP